MDLAERSPNNRRHPWETARAKAIIKIVHSLKPDNTPVRVLDIGCGDGFMLNELSRLFPKLKADGIDINLSKEETARLSSANVKFSNSPGDMHGKYDLILLMDVLEHIQNEADFLKSISFFATSDTWFIFTVPAHQILFSAHDLFLKHYRRYSYSMLARVLNTAGLAPQNHGSLFASLVIPRFFECLRDRIVVRHPDKMKGIGDWKQGSAVTAMAEKFFNSDNSLLWQLNKIGIRLPGLSLWATAKLKI